MIIARHDSPRCTGEGQFRRGSADIRRIAAISSGGRRFGYGAGVGPSNDKRTSSRESRGEWLVNSSDDVVAPMTTLEVIDALRKGALSDEALVWRVGMRDWTPVMDVPQLRLAASSRPPPAVAPSVESAPVTAATVAAPADAALHENSAEYDDSPAHFESVNDSELEESDEPVTTLMQDPTLSIMHGSLAPTTAEAAASPGAPSGWEHLDELLAGERRAEQQHTRRVVFWAALGSAAMAAAFTLFLVRSPAREESRSAQAEQPNSAPELVAAPVPVPTATFQAPASARAALDPAPTASAVPTAKSGAPRVTRRPKHAAAITTSPDAPSDVTPAADEAAGSPAVAIASGAPPEATPNASAAPPSTAAPSSESP
jgi:hypothetical protein